MAHDHLSNDEFLTKVGQLLATTQTAGHGSVHLTQKRLTYDISTGADGPPATKVPDDPLWDLHPPNPLPLIVRATDGKSRKNKDDRKRNPDKVKLSTIVQPDDIEGFFARYADVCKAGMQSLRKRDRSKRKKEKGKKKKAAGAGGEEKKG